MRRTTIFGTVVVALTAGVGVAATPASAATTELFVNNQVACSDAGTGSQAQPFCTLAAASAVVTGGQTVQVKGTYRERLTIARSGAPGSPITFRNVVAEPNGTFVLSGPDAGITIAGQHDVSVTGVSLDGDLTGPTVVVTNSTRIALERLRILQVGLVTVPGIRLAGVTDSTIVRPVVSGSVAPAVSLDAATSRVTMTGATIGSSLGRTGAVEILGSHNAVLRSTVYRSTGVGIAIGPGATDTVVAGNASSASQTFGIENAGATGTAIVNNTVSGNCGSGIRVSGGSTGVSVQNNDVKLSGSASPLCGTVTVEKFDIGVRDAAVSGTTVDYNTVRSQPGNVPYAWGAASGTLAEFRTVSGQGGHDANGEDPAANIDSANSAAPGWPATDRVGRFPEDDPGTADTGAGPVPYADRGATERTLGPVSRLTVTSQLGNAQVTADASASTPGWVPIASYTFDFGDGATVTQTGPVATHTYAQRVYHPVKVRVTDTNGLIQDAFADYDPRDAYVPVGPVRILDTREAIGTPGRTPVPAGGTVTLPVAGRAGVPAEGVTSVTMNVTVTEPTGDGFLTVYPSGEQVPTASNLNWTRGLTVPNLVVMRVVDGKVNFSHSGAGTVHLVADLVGYHTGGVGSSFLPVGPVRALDTREAIGTPGRTPVAPGGTLTLPVAGRTGIPATGVTAVTMNVTVTEPTSAGFLTVYPNGRALPNASNLNWTAGQTVPNLVVVPVIDGKVNFRNSGPGTVHVVADVVGYHTTEAGSLFKPWTPLRILDTRTRLGTSDPTPTPVGPGATIDLRYPVLIPGDAASVVLNVTVTEPTSEGFLTVYGDFGQPLPNASNLNWRRGQTVPNLVVVRVNGANSTIRIFNSGPGTVHVVADLVGVYY
ncbi:right-handed parallel beta-helix repeat-containing protein [Longispora sp. NPDC051575]|uniref:right-handed parallel beta-helix repeat-containing protein n=1 Tax=Longispora sp. NPDC051575 TaxID=3154943 RepID=UPI00343E96EE